jgi:large subunit ribosomal protein L9
MDVLLKEDVDNLGRRGEVVRVRSGYGRNYLLPQGLAIEASAGNRRMIEEQKKVLVKQEERERAAAQGQADRLDGLELRFERRVGEHGILYGSVTVLDIVEALKEQGYTIERRRISLRDHIKEVGDYDVEIKLHREVRPVVKVKVRRPGAEDEEAATEQAAAELAPEASSETVEAASAVAAADTEATAEAAGTEEASQDEQ